MGGVRGGGGGEGCFLMLYTCSCLLNPCPVPLDPWTIGLLDPWTLAPLYSCTLGRFDNWPFQFDFWIIGICTI